MAPLIKSTVSTPRARVTPPFGSAVYFSLTARECRCVRRRRRTRRKGGGGRGRDEEGGEEEAAAAAIARAPPPCSSANYTLKPKV